MSAEILRRRLRAVHERLQRLRAELAVTEEQARYLEEEAEDARLRALVAETPITDAEATEARRHADALGAHREHLRREIERLVAEQDTLLDRMAAELGASRGAG